MQRPASMHGFSMVEVLITVVVIAVGLLGLAGLQSKLQVSELESYQRAQALMLLQDMSNRINANRASAADYVTGTASPLGTGAAASVCAAPATVAEQDACEWSELLKGAAETSGGIQIGAMLGGRGCVESLGGNEYLITVAWQGMTSLAAPPAGVGCGLNLYNDAGTACVDDLCRRVVTTVVRIGTL